MHCIGVVHVTDSVLLPWTATHDVLNVIGTNPGVFSTLIDLAVHTGIMVDLLSIDEATYTIFAPTNAG